jgi:hypothetical protein
MVMRSGSAPLPIHNEAVLIGPEARAPLHELPSLKCMHIITAEFEPFPVLALVLKSLVPVRFDARRVVSSYRMDSV